MPRIVKVISGGQTGADAGGLIAARILGIETGGWMPKGWRTELGAVDRSAWGLQEHYSREYPPRTLANIQAADLTIIVAKSLDRGSALTVRYCDKAHCPYWVATPSDNEIPVQPIWSKFAWADDLTLNVAGNRESRSPGIQRETVRLIGQFLREFNKV